MSSIFISYRRKDVDQLQPLLDALKLEGVDYWLDTRDIEPFADFSDAVVAALSDAKLFLAWYSRDYPESRACQWEFTAAFLAAQQEADPFRRVLVINSEPSDDHLLLPQEIRGQNIRTAPGPDDAEGFTSLAKDIANHLQKVKTPLGQIRPGEKPPYYGRKITHSERFVGRLKEFWKIHWALHNGSDRTITAAAPVHMVQLIGLGGMGKSMFAEEYAARYGWAYPGGVFWLDAYGAEGRTPDSMEAFAALRHQQLEQIARELGMDPKGQDMALLPGMIRHKLEDGGKTYLWIVDDLPAGLEFKELDLWLAPDTAHGKTLITTRTTNYDKRCAAIRLDRLDPVAAYLLLTRDREPDDSAEKEAAEGIVADLGGHPLALELAAATLESYAGMTSFAEYRAMLYEPREDALKLAEDFVDMLPNGHEKSIAVTMSHSLQLLGEEGLDFLRLAAQLSPAPIPASLVFATLAIADGIEEPKAKLRAAQAFNQTEKHSFSQVVEPKQGMRIVHALVSRVIRFDSAHTSRCQALRAAAVQALDAVLHDVVDIRNHRLLEHHVSHARELVKHLANEDNATLGLWVARHDHERGDYSLSCMLLEKIIPRLEELLGEEHPDTLTSINNLAETLREQGDLHRARALQEKTLHIRRRVLGEEHPETLTSMNNLALTLKAQGDLPGARDVHEKELDICRRVLGEEHPDTLTSMNNLALTLKAQGEVAGARGLQEKALEMRRRVLGEEHPDTLISMCNLAEILRTENDLISAGKLQARALEILRHVLGEEHPITVTAINNLAETLWQQGDAHGARELGAKALDIRRRLLGKEHPDTSASGFSLFGTLLVSGAHEEAAHILETDLIWLVKCDPINLGADQRYIREQLVEFLKKKQKLAPLALGTSGNAKTALK